MTEKEKGIEKGRCDVVHLGVTMMSDAVSPTSWSLQRPSNSPFLFKICYLDLASTVALNNKEKRSEFRGRDKRWTLLAAGQRCADREQQTFESLVVTSKRKISHLQGWILSSAIDFGGFAEEKWNFNHWLSHGNLFWDLGQRSAVMLLVCNFICISDFCCIPVSLLLMSGNIFLLYRF